MEDKTITNSQLTSSGNRGALHQAAYGRLNLHVDGVKQGWIPYYYHYASQWLLIDLHRQTLITGIVMQGQYRGSYSSPHWTKTYKVSTSLDNAQHAYVRDENGDVEVKLNSFYCCLFFFIFFLLLFIHIEH